MLQTWLILAATIGFAIASTSWLLTFAAIVVIGTQQHALFILSHEAAHYRLFTHRGCNDLVGRICASAAGLSMCTYRIIHRLHHNDLYGTGPRYRTARRLSSWKMVSVRKSSLISRALPRSRLTSIFREPARNTAAQTTLAPLDDTSATLRVAARSDQKFVIALQLALPGLMLWVGGWPGLVLYLVLWVLPAVTVLQATRLRAISEHGAAALRHAECRSNSIFLGSTRVARGAANAVPASRALPCRASSVSCRTSLSFEAVAPGARQPGVTRRCRSARDRDDDADDLRRPSRARPALIRRSLS